MYSFLLDSVTSFCAPFGSSSIVSIDPKRLFSIVNVRLKEFNSSCVEHFSTSCRHLTENKTIHIVNTKTN